MPLFAARLLDATPHPGAVGGPGVPTVTIGGRAAAVEGDAHICAFPSPTGPHPPNNFAIGSKTVRIGGRGALRVGDLSGCGAPIITGAPNVIIGG
jgi:uncharacterized Zn-binding protein involved in type VI secretion